MGVGFVNRRNVTIEWGDCDAAGIVFYPRYFAMFDWSTASLFCAALGMKKPAMLDHYGIVGIPMVDTRAKFSRPCTFGDEVVIESRVEKFGRSSFDVHHLLTRDDALCVECWESRVWVGRHPDDPKGIKGVPIPAEVVARFGL
jgi:4-hydroxybenzoyl-CoA thioesterase